MEWPARSATAGTVRQQGVYQSCEYPAAAAGSYGRMLEINEYLAESDNAYRHREPITGIARRLRC